ncbi:60S ribosomal protein L14 [Oopsacas minuta]|uniref:Large ribosomal subunit protein eL14 n=1 Tax=Oopsacas minuta TaxID=111878 RepID=A0AAV7JMH1_9METZ|nr:60S ribosomal protein L14 [Oopsacas minuta]
MVHEIEGDSQSLSKCNFMSATFFAFSLLNLAHCFTSKMVFDKFVEVGRIILITQGPYTGKLAAIVDVIDQNRILIDGSTMGVPRMPFRLKNIKLTGMKVKFPHSAGQKVVKQALDVGGIGDKWKTTSWAKKLEKRKIRKNLNDFDRFKLKKLKQRKSRIVSISAAKVRKELKEKQKK